MAERDREDTPAPPNPGAPRSDNAEMMRRAILAVAAAQRLVAESQAGRERRAYGRPRRNDHRTPAENAEAEVATLRASVEAYVRPLRDAGEPPERVLARLKATMDDTPTPDQPHGEREILWKAAVGWGIQEYFRRR